MSSYTCYHCRGVFDGVGIYLSSTAYSYHQGFFCPQCATYIQQEAQNRQLDEQRERDRERQREQDRQREREIQQQRDRQREDDYRREREQQSRYYADEYERNRNYVTSAPRSNGTVDINSLSGEQIDQLYSIFMRKVKEREDAKLRQNAVTTSGQHNATVNMQSSSGFNTYAANISHIDSTPRPSSPTTAVKVVQDTLLPELPNLFPCFVFFIALFTKFTGLDYDTVIDAIVITVGSTIILSIMFNIGFNMMESWIVEHPMPYYGLLVVPFIVAPVLSTPGYTLLLAAWLCGAWVLTMGVAFKILSKFKKG